MHLGFAASVANNTVIPSYKDASQSNWNHPSSSTANARSTCTNYNLPSLNFRETIHRFIDPLENLDGSEFDMPCNYEQVVQYQFM